MMIASAPAAKGAADEAEASPETTRRERGIKPLDASA
jgi:hypothetical protein